MFRANSSSSSSNHEPSPGRTGGGGGGDLWSKVKRTSVKAVTSSKHISAKAVTSSKNTKETISIQKKQTLMLERKKAFGAEYMELLEDGAPPEELQACVDRCAQDVLTLQNKVAKYKERIATNAAKLDQALSTRESHTQPSIHTTDMDPSAPPSHLDSEDSEEEAIALERYRQQHLHRQQQEQQQQQQQSATTDTALDGPRTTNPFDVFDVAFDDNPSPRRETNPFDDDNDDYVSVQAHLVSGSRVSAAPEAPLPVAQATLY